MRSISLTSIVISSCGPASKRVSDYSSGGGVGNDRPTVPSALGLLAGDFGPEIMGIRHSSIGIGIQIPPHGPLGERLLRFGNFFEQCIFRRLAGQNLIEGLELLLQDRIGRFIKLNF